MHIAEQSVELRVQCRNVVNLTHARIVCICLYVLLSLSLYFSFSKLQDGVHIIKYRFNPPANAKSKASIRFPPSNARKTVPSTTQSLNPDKTHSRIVVIVGVVVG